MSIYVRQDVFDAKMEAMLNEIRGDIKALSAKIDGVEAKLSAKIDGVKSELTEKIDGVKSELTGKIDGVEAKLTAKIDGVEAKLTEKIEGINARLSSRIDNLDARISDLRNGFYLVVVLFGTLFGWPMFNKWYEEREKNRKELRRQSFTLEDVERLIDAKLKNFSTQQTML